MGEKKGKGSGLGIVGYDTYEFVVADAERSRRFYKQMMDVPEVARLDQRAGLHVPALTCGHSNRSLRMKFRYFRSSSGSQ